MLARTNRWAGPTKHARCAEGSVADAWADLPCRELAELVPIILFVGAPDAGCSATRVGPKTESMLGYAGGECLGDPGFWARSLYPEDRERVLEQHRRMRRGGEKLESEYRLIARDGSVMWVREVTISVGHGEEGPGLWAGVLSDITDRKHREKKLEENEERFRLVAKATGEAIWDNDLATGRQEWDGATEALFGYPPHQDGTGAWWEERIHPDDRGRVLCGLRAILDRGEEWEDEYRFRRADGSYARVLDRGLVVRDGVGRPLRMVGAMADVTERRLFVERLKASEDRFRTAFEAAAVGMAHVAPDGSWLRVNDKLCEISGYPREELLGMTYGHLTPPEDRESSQERARQLLAGQKGPYSVEGRFAKKDGSRAWVNVTVSLARTPPEEPDHFVCVVEDITARKLDALVPEGLTGRELDILRRVVLGRTNPQIAKELSHSLGTVKRDLRIVLCKLGARNRNEAARCAVDIGLVAP